MGGKRMVDMSYTTSESAEVRPRSFNRNRKSDLLFSGDKGRDDSTTPPIFLHGKYSTETEGDADTWSIEQDPPSSLPSAKFGYGDQKHDKDGQHHGRNNFDFQIGRNHQMTNKRNLQRGLTDTGESFGETTDEEFITNCITNMSSASSSISWAEDAVEAELTKKIFGLWDDVQKVITGETNGKPDDMTSNVYEECLRWKRVFPTQNLDRFSKYSEDAATPSPVKKNRHVISSRSTPNYKSSSPDSPNPLTPPVCLTPNPEKNSHYVSLWLSDCRSKVPQMSSSQETIVQDNFNSPPLSQSARNKECRSGSSTPAHLNYHQHHPHQMESDTTETRAFNVTNFNHRPLPAPRLSNSSSSSNSNNLKNLHLRYSTEASEPDPTNFFTQLALDDTLSQRSSVNSMTKTKVYHEYHDGFVSATTDTYNKPVCPPMSKSNTSNNGNSSSVVQKLRVQRPISSNVKGHLLTPLSTSTKLSHLPHPPASSSSLSLSKSFREQSFSNSSSNFKSNSNSKSSTLPPAPFHHPPSSASSYPHNFKYPNPHHTEEDDEEEPPCYRAILLDSGNESSDNCYFHNFSMKMPISMSTSSPNRSIKSKSTVTSSHPVFLPTIPSSPSYSEDRSSVPTRQRPFSKSTRTSVSVINNNNNNIHNNNSSSSNISNGSVVGAGVSFGGSNNNNNNNSAYVKSRMFDYISDSGSGSGLDRMKYSGPKGPSSISSNQSQSHGHHLTNRGLMSGNSGAGSASSSVGGGIRTIMESGPPTLMNGLNGTSWSRHSSISESFSVKLQNNTNNMNFNTNSDSNSNSNNMPLLMSDTPSLSMLGMGMGSGFTTTTTTTTTSDGINDDYFPHQLYPPYDLDSHLDQMSMLKLRRPDFLAVSKEAEFPGISTSSSSSVGKSKPVRPFLYWLLDKVSPS